MNFFSQFWAPRDVYAPTGMFTKGHLTLLILCLALLAVLLRESKTMTKGQVIKLTRVLAVLMTVLEGTKIFFNLSKGYTWINAWMPIAYCSIFMYALWLSGYGKGVWKQYGDSFLAGAGIIAGASYLLFPSTSLMMYPMWHYLCLYSMFFHTLMIYVGLLYLKKLEIQLDWALYCKYTKLYLVFAAIAVWCNTLYDSNLMLLRHPFQIPVKLLHTLYERSPWGYTGLVFFVYLIVPYWITALLCNSFRKNTEVEAEQVLN